MSWVATAIVGSAIVGAVGSRSAARSAERAAQGGIDAQQAGLRSFETRTEPFRQLGLAAAPQLLNLLGIAPPPGLTNAPFDPALQENVDRIADIDAELERLNLLGGDTGGLVETLQTTRNRLQSELDQSAEQNFGTVDPAQAGLPAQPGQSSDALLSQINPLVSFLRDEGFEDIQESAAAEGRLRSGGTLQDLSRFNTGLASTVVPQLQQQRFNQLFNLLSSGQNAATGQGTAQLQTASNVSNLLGNIGSAQGAGALGTAGAIQGGISGLTGFLGAQQGGAFGQTAVAPQQQAQGLLGSEAIDANRRNFGGF